MEIWLLPETWLSLLTLILLEIVLGVDNLVFLAIVTGKLPREKQKFARKLGLFLACGMRLLLLATVVWLAHLTAPLFSIFQKAFSIRDIVLIGGGLFLLVKSTNEIHDGIVPRKPSQMIRAATFLGAIVQIVLLDIIFSLDSVLTAVALTQEFIIMALAIMIAVMGMLLASEFLTRMVNRYPTLKMLALSFLLLIGTALIADGFAFHIPRTYLYFAMGFSIFVESLNILASRKS